MSASSVFIKLGASIQIYLRELAAAQKVYRALRFQGSVDANGNLDFDGPATLPGDRSSGQAKRERTTGGG